MKIAVKIVKAFTTDPTQGNPAGVINDTFGLDNTQMQLIAKKVGVSECVFITDMHGIYKLRYFSPTKEMDFCGHATIAAFHALRLKDSNIPFETRLGTKQIEINSDGIYWLHMGKLEQHYIVEDSSLIADLLGIKTEDIQMVQVYSVGVPKLLIRIPNLNTLFKLKPKYQEISDFCQSRGIKGFYPFTSETLLPDSTFHARQFNPLVGINEDPITGVAGAALGAWYGKDCIIEQGYCMNSFGRMFVKFGDIIKVGGYAITYEDICIEI